MKEYSFTEVISIIKEGQTYRVTNIHYNLKTVTKINGSIVFEVANRTRNLEIIEKLRLALVRQPVSFLEAVQAYSKGKTIRNMYHCNESIYMPTALNHAPLQLKDTNGYCISAEDIQEGVWFVNED